MPQSVTSLVALVRDGTDEQKANAADALQNLACNNDANRVAIADAGGIAPLVALMVRDGTDEQKANAADALHRARVTCGGRRQSDQGIGPPEIGERRPRSGSRIARADTATRALSCGLSADGRPSHPRRPRARAQSVHARL